MLQPTDFARYDDCATDCNCIAISVVCFKCTVLVYKHLKDNVSVIIYIYKYIAGLVFVMKHKKLVAVAPLCTARMIVFAGTEGPKNFMV